MAEEADAVDPRGEPVMTTVKEKTMTEKNVFLTPTFAELIAQNFKHQWF